MVDTSGLMCVRVCVSVECVYCQELKLVKVFDIKYLVIVYVLVMVGVCLPA